MIRFSLRVRLSLSLVYTLLVLKSYYDLEILSVTSEKKNPVLPFHSHARVTKLKMRRGREETRNICIAEVLLYKNTLYQHFHYISSHSLSLFSRRLKVKKNFFTRHCSFFSLPTSSSEKKPESHSLLCYCNNANMRERPCRNACSYGHTYTCTYECVFCRIFFGPCLFSWRYYLFPLESRLSSHYFYPS